MQPADSAVVHAADCYHRRCAGHTAVRKRYVYHLSQVNSVVKPCTIIAAVPLVSEGPALHGLQPQASAG
jgi:hypothetical protein